MNDLSLSETTLRPDLDQVLSAWRRLVEAEGQQVESLPNRPRPEDFYAPVAGAFRADPRREDDPSLVLLRPLLRANETWLDLGAGAGRYALPVALATRRVYAVEPSAGMRNVLAEAMHSEDVHNIEVFAERWPVAQSAVPVADCGFISQVGYDIADIGPFIDQLEAHCSRLCAALLFDQAPISEFAPLWQPVHGEKRVLLPALPAFLTLLFARDRLPEVALYRLPLRTYADREALLSAARRPLWVLPGTPEDERLRRAVEEQAREVEGGVCLSGRERALGLVTWRPS